MRSGIPLLDAKLQGRYGHNFSTTFEVQKILMECFRKENSMAEDKRWQVLHAVKLQNDCLVEFIDAWIAVRDYWKVSMSDFIKLDCPKLLHFALCLEQNVHLLHKNINFEDASRLFGDRSSIPHSFQKVEIGDIVVYDHMRHEYAAKLSKARIQNARKSTTESLASGKSSLLHQAHSIPFWLGDEPMHNGEGGRVREFLVYLVQYFPGGGEPYCVLTLGPKTKKRRIPDTSKPDIVNGRKRTNKFCKLPHCNLFSLEGNFGYCEDHRAVDPKELKQLRTMYDSKNDVFEPDEYCYLCFVGASADQPFVKCSQAACPRAYHKECLVELTADYSGESWICPMHDDEEDDLQSVIMQILDRLCNFPSAEPFLHPVTDQPGYYDVVEHPMCFQQMRGKALLNKYSSAAEVISDMQLLVRNCHSWCDSRYPTLPPVAERLRRTLISAMKKEGLNTKQKISDGNHTDEAKDNDEDDFGETNEVSKRKRRRKAKAKKVKRKSIRQKVQTGSPEVYCLCFYWFNMYMSVGEWSISI